MTEYQKDLLRSIVSWDLHSNEPGYEPDLEKIIEEVIEILTGDHRDLNND